MNRPARLFTLASLLSLGVVAITGCSSATATPDSPSEGVEGLTAGRSPSCSGKACGVDCSAAGSDEPFNCNSAGRCVATGQPLGCGDAGACPEFLGDCIAGETAVDRNGDGCIDGCAPYVSGRVLLPQALTKSALTIVEVLDVTLADAPSIRKGKTTVAATGGAPIAYHVTVLAKIDPKHSYSVRAHVDVDGDGKVSKGDYVTTQSYPVLTHGFGWTADVSVHLVP